MTKGTASMGKKSGKKNFIRCRRCGNLSYHIKDKKCAKCGFGATTKMKFFAWFTKKNGKKRRK